MKKYTVGIDFGSLSGRALLMDIETGETVATVAYEYPHGVMSDTLPCGKPLQRATALQHPQDYIDVLRITVPEVLRLGGVSPDDVLGFGIDFTACTMLPIRKDGTPLCFEEKYRSEAHAYVKMWKDHSSVWETDELNRIASERGEKWLGIYGGKTTSEWMFPKVWQTLREAPELYDDTYRFVESADFLSLLLTGKETHSAPYAGYKALWNAEDGFPSPEFFGALSPKLRDIIGTKISADVTPIDNIAGYLCASGAELVGLNVGTPVALPLVDAHASMPALGITDEGTLMLILGTSACHIINSRNKKDDIPGIGGFVYGGVYPNMYTYEAGQACCGDHFAWFIENGVPASYVDEAKSKNINIHRLLREKAQKLRVGESGLVALDWFNGNRSILADASLKGMIVGMTLHTKPEEIYRALIEATAYGTRKIIENFVDHGIAIDKIVATGGIAEKDEMLVQIYADVTGRPIIVSDAKLSASRGSAIAATVAAGIYPDIIKASEALGIRTGKTYLPIKENSTVYNELYAEYERLHEYFGMGGNDVMRRLGKIADLNSK